jgi:hypothetical protein
MVMISFVGANSLLIGYLQRIREVAFICDLVDDHRLSDVVCCLVEFSEPQVGIVLVVYHELRLNLEDLDPLPKLVFPLFLTLLDDAVYKGKNLLVIGCFFDFLRLLELPLKSGLQFTALFSQKLLERGKLCKGSLIGR